MAVLWLAPQQTNSVPPTKATWSAASSATVWVRPPIFSSYRPQDDPVYVEGVKAKYAVRAALDPAWADPLSVLRILNPSPETWEDVAGMSRAHRIEVAVAALRAYAEHRPASPPVHLIRFGGLVEHRVVRQHTFTVSAQEGTVTT